MGAEHYTVTQDFLLFTAHTFSISSGFELSQAALPNGWGGGCNPSNRDTSPSVDIFYYDLAHVGNPKISLVN